MLDIRRNIYYLRLVTQKSYLSLEIVNYICKFYFAPLCTFLLFFCKENVNIPSPKNGTLFRTFG